MTGLNHDWDRPYGPDHADFVHGAVDEDDFEHEVNYTPRKKKKGCKKSKSAEPCDFTVPRVIWSYKSHDTDMWNNTIAMTCHRCGKHGPWKTTYTREQSTT